MIEIGFAAIFLLVISPALVAIGNYEEHRGIWAAGVASLIIGEILNVFYLAWFFTTD